MQDMNQKHWLDQLEVTDSIKGIMEFVDELSRNYDRRVAALHVDYQNDVDEILACYKHEKQEFATQLQEQQAMVTRLQNDLNALQQSYSALSIEHKLAKDSLETARHELSMLTKALKEEDQMINLAKERIRVINEQLKQELELRGVEPAEPAKTATVTETGELDSNPVPRPKVRFKRTRDFFVQVVADRLTRPIILRPKRQEPIIMPDEEGIIDKDEYSF